MIALPSLPKVPLWAIAVAAGIGLLFGRGCAKPEIKTVTVESATNVRMAQELEQRRHEMDKLKAQIAQLSLSMRRVRVVTRSPDGASKSETTTEFQAQAQVASTEQIKSVDAQQTAKDEMQAQQTAKTATPAPLPSWRLGPAVSFNFRTGRIGYGAELSRRWGRFYLGGSVTSAGIAQGVCGVEF